MTAKKLNSVSWYTSTFLITGLALLIGGIYLTYFYLETIKDGAAYFFIIFLPVPMGLFGFYAVISAFRQKEPLKNDNIPPTSSPSNGKIKHIHTAENKLKKENQIVGSAQSENKKVGFGSAMLYSFLVLGIVIMLAIALGSVLIDINKGITQSCLKASNCHDIYFKDSPTSFYIALILNTFKVLIFPVIIGFFVKKWLDEK